tara:strand:- start:1249 stop:1689 length:441 start_codon:yes stop_codon:yes gene_type:complete
MIITNRDGSTESVEGPDKNQMDKNVKFVLSHYNKDERLNEKVDIKPEDLLISEEDFEKWNSTEEEEVNKRQTEMDALNAKFEHEDHAMSLEEFEGPDEPTDEQIEDEMIERDIEHIQECQMGMHGHQPQRWANEFGTMRGFKGKYW